MKLSQSQVAELRKRGIYLTEACDGCGQLLGSVRSTRKGDPGDGGECRDGKAEAQKHEERVARKAGRPPLNLTENSRRVRRKKQIREAVSRFRSNVIKNWQQPVEAAELAGAKIEVCV